MLRLLVLPMILIINLALEPARCAFVGTLQKPWRVRDRRVRDTATFKKQRRMASSSSLLSSSSTTTALQMTPIVLPFLQDAIGLSLVSSVSSMPIHYQLQTVGETAFAASVLLAVVQGALIMHSYANHPLGELIAPPGLTVGTEDASTTTTTTTATTTTTEPSRNHHRSSSSSDAPRHLSRDETVKDSVGRMSPETSSATTTRSSPSLAAAELTTTTTTTTTVGGAKTKWHHVTKYMALLLPWLISQGSFALIQYGHLMHMGVIVALMRVYDFFHKIPKLPNDNDDINPVDRSSLLISQERRKPKVMVLGDSMAVGIGCVNVFDANKNSGILKRIEKLQFTAEEEETREEIERAGPVFPQVLARTLSERLQQPVDWRSAGVDGGDTTDIRDYLVSCVQEEADTGRAPDIVVVLTGANDLKRIISLFPNSKPCASVRGFQSNLIELVQDIHRISPKTKDVFPALPTYRLDKNSILNVFPLNFFLDGLFGFWDSQKIRAANKADHVYYYGLTPDDVNSWYHDDDHDNDDDGQQDGEGTATTTATLLAADGIHPNAKCYAKWATLIGNKLADTLQQEEENTIDRRQVQQQAFSTRDCTGRGNNKKGQVLPSPVVHVAI